RRHPRPGDRTSGMLQRRMLLGQTYDRLVWRPFQRKRSRNHRRPDVGQLPPRPDKKRLGRTPGRSWRITRPAQAASDAALRSRGRSADPGCVAVGPSPPPFRRPGDTGIRDALFGRAVHYRVLARRPARRNLRSVDLAIHRDSSLRRRARDLYLSASQAERGLAGAARQLTVKRQRDGGTERGEDRELKTPLSPSLRLSVFPSIRNHMRLAYFTPLPPNRGTTETRKRGLPPDCAYPIDRWL